jgi:hypothetical protein
MIPIGPAAACFAVLIPLLTPRTHEQYGPLYRRLDEIYTQASKQMGRQYPYDKVHPKDPGYDAYLERRSAYYESVLDEELRDFAKSRNLSIYLLKDIKHEGDARGWGGDGDVGPPKESVAREDLYMRRILEASQWNIRAKALLTRRATQARALAEEVEAATAADLRRAATLIRQAEAMQRAGNRKAAKEYAEKAKGLAPAASEPARRATEILKAK